MTPEQQRTVLEANEDEIDRLRFACAAAEQFLSGLKVPQTVDEAALQVIVGGGVLEQLRAALTPNA